VPLVVDFDVLVPLPDVDEPVAGADDVVLMTGAVP
jgi:hypothetical protein